MPPPEVTTCGTQRQHSRVRVWSFSLTYMVSPSGIQPCIVMCRVVPLVISIPLAVVVVVVVVAAAAAAVVSSSRRRRPRPRPRRRGSGHGTGSGI